MSLVADEHEHFWVCALDHNVCATCGRPQSSTDPDKALGDEGEEANIWIDFRTPPVENAKPAFPSNLNVLKPQQ